MIAPLLGAGVGLLGLWLIFGPLEWAFAAHDQKRWRPGAATDLAFFLGQSVVWGALTVSLLHWMLQPLASWSSLAAVRSSVADLPLALQVVTAIVAGDLLLYWGHRLQHHNAWLWRFHGVHHTAQRLDFLAAHREHPLDGVYTRLIVNLPAVALGLPLDQMLGIIAFRGVWATFIHANVAIELGPLGMLLGAPRLHRWHHALPRNAGNYANLAPWIDWLFGTYHNPARSPSRLGTPEPWPQTYLGLLIHPFRRRRAPHRRK